MAKWVLVHDTGTGGRAFIRNEGDILARQGYTDAVFGWIGPGARSHLEDAGIRGWLGRPGVPSPS